MPEIRESPAKFAIVAKAAFVPTSAAVTTKVSIPSPALIESATVRSPAVAKIMRSVPVPPVIESAPVPEVTVLAPLPVLIASLPEPPVNTSLPEPPVKVPPVVTPRIAVSPPVIAEALTVVTEVDKAEPRSRFAAPVTEIVATLTPVPVVPVVSAVNALLLLTVVIAKVSRLLDPPPSVMAIVCAAPSRVSETESALPERAASVKLNV